MTDHDPRGAEAAAERIALRHEARQREHLLSQAHRVALEVVDGAEEAYAEAVEAFVANPVRIERDKALGIDVEVPNVEAVLAAAARLHAAEVFVGDVTSDRDATHEAAKR